jgi:hypothetical protein
VTLRSLGAISAITLIAALCGCPALLSNDWTIAAGPSEAGSGAQQDNDAMGALAEPDAAGLAADDGSPGGGSTPEGGGGTGTPVGDGGPATEGGPGPVAVQDAGPSTVCPDGGCPSLSTPSGFTCAFGTCNGASNQCTTPGACFCSHDSQCTSGKCVQVTRENDLSCGGNCTGSGPRDGFNCALASPGIPSLASSGGTYSCPGGSGYKNTTLTCDPTHTNCYCTARQPVHERQVHPEREQRLHLTRVHGHRDRGLPGLPGDRVGGQLPDLHRVPHQQHVRVPGVLLHVRRRVRQRPLHPELSQRQLLRLHGDGSR